MSQPRLFRYGVSAIKISYLSTSDLVFLFLAVLGDSWRSVLFFLFVIGPK